MARHLLAAPVTLPCALVLALFLAWVPDDVGYPVTAWAPMAVLVLGLLAVSVVTLPNAWGDLPAPVRLAAGALLALTLWSYASIAWSHDPGVSHEGANRTLLYLAVFSLFALWPQREHTAAVLLGGWTAGMVGLGAIVLVDVAGAGSDVAGLFVGDRLADPAGYPNAAAATWLMVMWPAVAIAASPAVPAWIRGAFAGGATLLVPLAVLSQSRGSLFAVPITAALVLVALPHRARHVAVLGVVAAGAALAVWAALDVSDALGPEGTGDAGDELSRVTLLTALGALLVGAVTGAAAHWEGRGRSERAHDALRSAGRRVAAGLVVLVVAGGLVAMGDPVDRVDSAWSSFTEGYEGNDADANRLVGGLGSNRADFYDVALDEFRDHPIVGTGVDTYAQAYLRAGDSAETPRYAHSLPLRTLQGLGLIGAALLLAFAAAVLWAAAGVLRSTGRLGRTVAIGALGTAAYWTVHGSADWFWEFAGLGAPVFALLGLVCALHPRVDAERSVLLRARTAGEVTAVVALTVGLVVIVAAPWLAQRDIERAANTFAERPREAYSRLDRAARLDPFSDRAALLEGSIALRYGDLPRARDAFTRALDRVPDGAYATLQLGAILSVLGEAERAAVLLDRAVALAPRDPLAREARVVVRDGGVVDLVALSRRILIEASGLVL
jgi:tetratricopeptide (TPR) repeat protein